METADHEFWVLIPCIGGDRGNTTCLRRRQGALARRYRAASLRALAGGFIYAPADERVRTVALEALLDRLRVVGAAEEAKAKALPGATCEAWNKLIAEPQTLSSAASKAISDEWPSTPDELTRDNLLKLHIQSVGRLSCNNNSS